jgi:hypothetical protein
VKRFDERVLPREPGSMYAVPALEKRHQSCRAWAVSSGPLSILKHSGAMPRSATSRSSSATVVSASMLRATCITSASRVNSSTTFNTRITRPSAV